MPADLRVEHQAEVPGRREELFPLVTTEAGLRRWLDEAELEPRVGGHLRLRLRDGVVIGEVVALDAPQHISWSWDWEGEPLGSPTVIAFDLIDHAERTHLTVRHVGFRSRAQRDDHDALWRHWFKRLVTAATELGQRDRVTATHPGA